MLGPMTPTKLLHMKRTGYCETAAIESTWGSWEHTHLHVICLSAFVSGFPCPRLSTLHDCGKEWQGWGPVVFLIKLFERETTHSSHFGNVWWLAAWHRNTFDEIVASLGTYGYKVFSDNSECRYNAQDNGLPNSWNGMLLVAFLADRIAAPFATPPPLKKLSLGLFFDWDNVINPGESPHGLCGTARRNIRHAYTTVKCKAVDPNVTAVVVDTACSKAFETWTSERMPCMTAAMCRNNSYFISTLGRRISIAEMFWLSGG